MTTSRPDVPDFERPPKWLEDRFDKVADILARFEGNDRYFILDEVLGDHDEAEDLNPEELEEFLRSVVGSPEECAADFVAMDDEEKAANFPDTKVRLIVEAYAGLRDIEDDEVAGQSVRSGVGLLLRRHELPLEALAEAAKRRLESTPPKGAA